MKSLTMKNAMKSAAFALAASAFALSVSVAPAAEADQKKGGAAMSDSAKPVVSMKTSMGEIKIELWPDKAPATVENFLQYARDGHYDGTIFHRVIDNFMIQGGGFTEDMKQKKTRKPVKNEARADTPNQRGTIAMARTSQVDSATCQFFINVKDNTPLNHRDKSPRGFGYCVFGKVVEGMDVVDKIKGVKTTAKGHFRDVPAETIEIEKVSVEDK